MKIAPLIAALAISAGGSIAPANNDARTALTERASNTAISEIRMERLGPEYEKIGDFFEFRKKLLEDGWVPVKNPDCMEAVAGGDGHYLCGKDQIDYASCRMCEVIPETFRSTGDGYSLMRYKKDGTTLGVSTYGDPQAIDQPKIYELVITGWHYDGSTNLILLDVAEDSAGESVAPDNDVIRVPRQERPSNTSPNEHRPDRLGPEYNEIETFAEFRKKLLQDGWTPVRYPQCMEITAGHDYKNYCGVKTRKPLSCRWCSLAPETFRTTMDGYMLLQYRKGDTVLGVSLYGDFRGMEYPDEYDLAITGWHYNGGIEVFLIGETDDKFGARP